MQIKVDFQRVPLLVLEASKKSWFQVCRQLTLLAIAKGYTKIII
jgi:hypothetical protein